MIKSHISIISFDSKFFLSNFFNGIKVIATKQLKIVRPFFFTIQSSNLMLINLFLSLAVISSKCYILEAIWDGTNINVCESVADYLFIQDIEDCTKYIVCVNGQAKSQQCRSGLYFDATQQACVDTRQSCLQCPSNHMVNLPLAKTCDKYISCYYGHSLLRKCDKNHQFNVKTGKCDLAQNVDCVENHCSIYTTDKDKVYIASAASCENYYVCQAGEAKLQSCSKGLYFSKKCNCCDKSDSVQCLAKDSKTMENYKQKRLSIDTSQHLYPSTRIGETNKVKCPPKGHFLYQYIEDPEYYFTCFNGKATFYACAKGFEFDNKLKRCTKTQNEESLNAVDNIKCPIGSNTTLPHAERNKYYLCIEGKKASVFACDPDLYYDANLKSCTNYEIDSTATDIICPKFGTFIYPHTKQNRYYVCVDGNAIGFACAKNHIFDTKTNTCQLDWIETGNNENETPIVLDEPVHILCPSIGIMKFAHTQGSKFYLCVNGMGSVLACAEGSFFESETGVCRRTFDLKKVINNTVTETIKTTEIAVEPSVQCPISGTFIYPHKDKKFYYVCLEGKSLILSCTEGLIFDANKKVCRVAIQNENVDHQTPVLLDEITNVVCPTSGAHRFSHMEKNKFYLCINGMSSVFACPEGSFFKIETGTCKEDVEQIKIGIMPAHPNEVSTVSCPKVGTFLYPHDDKHKYFICLDGSIYNYTCPEGLIFDSKVNACSKDYSEII